MMVRYAKSEEAWSDIVIFIEKLIQENGFKRILEIGAGANPTFPMSYVNKCNLDYTIFDISEEELNKAPSGYKTIHADIASPELALEGEYDFIFSRMLAEHVKDGESFHRNIFDLLSQDGIAFHFFPTLFAPPFIVNVLLPEYLARFALGLIQSDREQNGSHAKFPAYYSWCRGPITPQVKRFEGLGYKVEKYIGFFGHAGYYKKLPILEFFHNHLVGWLVNHPISYLTSFAYLELSKKQ